MIIYIDSLCIWKAVLILISWLLMKPTDQDLHCFQTIGVILSKSYVHSPPIQFSSVLLQNTHNISDNGTNKAPLFQLNQKCVSRILTPTGAIPGAITLIYCHQNKTCPVFQDKIRIKYEPNPLKLLKDFEQKPCN